MKEKNTLHLQKLWNQYSTVIILLITLMIFTMRERNFLTLNNLEKIIWHNSALLIIVMGLSFIMISGGLDLSIGYQISLISVFANIVIEYEIPDILSVILLTGLGILLGSINGVLIAYLDIAPFAATIATQVIFRGVSYLISEERMVASFPDIIRKMTRIKLAGVPMQLWIAVVCVCLTSILLHYTYYGKYVRAIGLNEEQAKRTGVPTKKIKCSVYCVAGGFYAIAAMILTSTKGYAGSETGVGIEITAMMAAFIGGILGQSQKIQISKLILGVLIIGIIDNGLPSIGTLKYGQYVFTGIILIISMVMNKKKNHSGT